MSSDEATRFNFLYTNIGRGHPYYLDGIIECMPPERIGGVTDVLDASTGLARQTWKLARFIYHSSGRSRGFSAPYNRLRALGDFNRAGLIQAMGRPLRKLFVDDPTPLVVAHPMLVAILKDKPRLLYQHGEIAAPRESWVRGRHLAVVPLSRTADVFLGAGFAPKDLFISGLCIEPALVSRAEDALNARLDRLAGSGPLCGAFFSSGAEPRGHVETLAAAALSAVAAGGRARVFARRSGFLAERVSAQFAEAERDLETVQSVKDLPVASPQALMCLYEDRRELNEFTEELFGSFDYFMAPSHEKTNWALGLGLPMFIVDPPLGSFSPLNREFLLARSVAKAAGSTQEVFRFGETLVKLRLTGELRAMAEAGCDQFDTRGFFNIAEMLQSL